MLAVDAKAVEAAGADVFGLACNTLHHVWETIVADVTIPTIHIGDALADALARDGRERVALLGTSATMTLPFMRDRIARARDRGRHAGCRHARADRSDDLR